jgi:hypothetical protein
MSILHPEFPLRGGRFDKFGPGSSPWLPGVFECLPNTGLAMLPGLQTGNDQRSSRGAQGGGRVVLHVMQGQHRLDHGGALPRLAAQLAGQHFPVLQARIAALAHAPELGLQPVRGPLSGRHVLPAGLAAAGNDLLVPAQVPQAGEHPDEGCKRFSGKWSPEARVAGCAKVRRDGDPSLRSRDPSKCRLCITFMADGRLISANPDSSGEPHVENHNEPSGSAS